MNKRSKKGSVSIQLCLILTSILILVASFADLSFAMVSRPYADAVLDPAGRSIMSEYDRDLKDRYGLFFFQLTDEEIEEKLDKYISWSFKKDRGKIDLLALSLEKVEIDTSMYAATKLDILHEQILENMKYKVLVEAAEILELIDGDKSKKDLSVDDREERKLMNSRIINELPSRQMEGAIEKTTSLLSFLKPSQIKMMTYEEICLNKYIMEHFSHKLKSVEDPSFFKNEIEYILSGHLNDAMNGNVMYLSLLAFRTAMNSLHIKSDSGKMNLVRAAALIVGEGVASKAVEASIIAIWAGAEGTLDVGKLERGKKVPLVKTKNQWSLSLEAALEGSFSQIEEEGEDTGLDYEDYLFIFLCLKNKNIKLVRIMDLIHLNIKGAHHKDFSYIDCSGGFTYEIQVKRNRAFLAHMFLKEGVFSGSHEY